MLRLKGRQREVLIEKWPDLANLAMAGLVFGQFLSAEPFSLSVAIGGLAIWIVVMVYVLTLAGGPR
jgi:hypothetical protein